VGEVRPLGEAPNEYVPEDFWRYVGRYLQQRVSGPFELDYVSVALFDLFFQGSYRLDVGLTVHTGPHAVMLEPAGGCLEIHRLTSVTMPVPGFLGLVVCGCGVEVMKRGAREGHYIVYSRYLFPYQSLPPW